MRRLCRLCSLEPALESRATATRCRSVAGTWLLLLGCFLSVFPLLLFGKDWAWIWIWIWFEFEFCGEGLKELVEEVENWRIGGSLEFWRLGLGLWLLNAVKIGIVTAF